MKKLPTKKGNKNTMVLRLLAARTRSSETGACRTLSEIPVAFRKKTLHNVAQRKSVCQPMFPALAAQENASKSIHSTQKREILGPRTRVFPSSNSCPLQKSNFGIIDIQTLLTNIPTKEITHHSSCEPNPTTQPPFCPSHSPKSQIPQMSLDSFGDLKVLLVDPDLVAHLKFLANPARIAKFSPFLGTNRLNKIEGCIS